MALAGGVRLMLSPEETIQLLRTEIDDYATAENAAKAWTGVDVMDIKLMKKTMK